MFGFNFGRFEKSSKAPQEKGPSKKTGNPLDFTPEIKEEEKFIKKNDPLKKFVPIEEVPAGDDWRHIGERLDQPQAAEDEPEELFSEESEGERMKKNREALDKLLGIKTKQPKKEEPELEPEIKTKFDKIGKREERKVLRGMSPVKRIPSSDLKIGSRDKKKPPDRENIKTMSESKKQRMSRGEIKKFLDSSEGQTRI